MKLTAKPQVYLSKSGALAIVGAPFGQRAMFTVESLSTVDAILVGSRPLVEGEMIRVVLVVGGPPIVVPGQAIRIAARDDRAHAITVSFFDVPFEVHQRIASFIASTLQRQRAASPRYVLVVDASDEVRTALVKDLAALLRHALGAATPREAVLLLEDVSLHIDTVIVEEAYFSTEHVDFCSYLKVEHPTIRRILFTDRLETPQTGDLRPDVHVNLAKPWDRLRLSEALTCDEDSGS